MYFCKSLARCVLPWASLFLLLAALDGCGHTAAARPATPGVKTPPLASKPTRLPLMAAAPPENTSMRDVMADHFAIMSWARNAVISGTIEPMREPLVALADYRYDDLPAGGWLPWVAQLQAAARLTSSASSLDVAASGVATMARICGECHAANHRGPTFRPLPQSYKALVADGVGQRMRRHIYGADLLWEGLTGPSDSSWQAGAQVLITAPDELDKKMPSDFAPDLLEVKQLGRKASEADTLAERADVYGLLIAKCAGCHTRWIEHDHFEPTNDDSDEAGD